MLSARNVAQTSAFKAPQRILHVF